MAPHYAQTRPPYTIVVIRIASTLAGACEWDNRSADVQRAACFFCRLRDASPTVPSLGRARGGRRVFISRRASHVHAQAYYGFRISGARRHAAVFQSIVGPAAGRAWPVENRIHVTRSARRDRKRRASAKRVYRTAPRGCTSAPREGAPPLCSHANGDSSTPSARAVRERRACLPSPMKVVSNKPVGPRSCFTRATIARARACNKRRALKVPAKPERRLGMQPRPLPPERLPSPRPD